MSAQGNGAEKPRLATGLRAHLSAMMFLEFAVWGAWFVLLSNYLGKTLGFSKDDIGKIYSTMPLGAIIAPLFVGQIADRYFSSEKLLAVLHLAGAGLLFWMARIQDASTFFWVALAYALAYNPTLALTNSVAFTHVPDATRDFPGIRVLGTIGWIVVNLAYLVLLEPDAPVSNLPFYLAAAISLALGVYSFALPKTPPPGKAGEVFPFLRAVGLLREPSFAVFFGVSFIITIALAFYYTFVGLFLQEGAGVDPQNVAPLTTIGQFAEMVLLPFLPFFIRRLGMKWVLVMGMAAWALRYGLFSVGSPFPLIIFGILLHGICFDFFFAAGFIHVENKSGPTIRASAQALFTFLTYGVGMWLGSLTAGGVAEAYQDPSGATEWWKVWLVPCVGSTVCLIVFAFLFRERRARPVEGEEPTVEPA